MPPEEKGIHITWPPRFCGGNIDCKELTKGSVLYLPIPVDGAYFLSEMAMLRKVTGKLVVKRSNAQWNP